MKITMKVAALAVLLAQTGCSSSDANDHNIKSAIKQYLAQDSQAFCLGLKKWPQLVTGVELQMRQTFPNARAGKMAYLEQARLVTSKEVKGETIGFFSSSANEYQLTAKGKEFQQQSGDVCFAKPKLKELIKWQQQSSSIVPDVVATYRYEATDVASWATAAAFKEIFSIEAAPVLGPVPVTVTLKLNEGHWQVVTPAGEVAPS